MLVNVALVGMPAGTGGTGCQATVVLAAAPVLVALRPTTEYVVAPVAADVVVQLAVVLVQPVQVYDVGVPVQLAVSVIGVLMTGNALFDASVHDTGPAPDGGWVTAFQLMVSAAGALGPPAFDAVTE